MIEEFTGVMYLALVVSRLITLSVTARSPRQRPVTLSRWHLTVSGSLKLLSIWDGLVRRVK